MDCDPSCLPLVHVSVDSGSRPTIGRAYGDGPMGALTSGILVYYSLIYACTLFPIGPPTKGIDKGRLLFLGRMWIAIRREHNEHRLVRLIVGGVDKSPFVLCFTLEEYRINVVFAFHQLHLLDGPKHIETTITRAKFEELCSDLLDRFMAGVSQILKETNYQIAMAVAYNTAKVMRDAFLLVTCDYEAHQEEEEETTTMQHQVTRSSSSEVDGNVKDPEDD
ncbi:hypothetical protein Syun_001814 [Stephania yunnanensis]|uniref:Uncharacterized protein n=1 Tax=Stephania yunnanensis TaxID=152371 RepID=A0AAP0Q857_9MAGN